MWKQWELMWEVGNSELRGPARLCSVSFREEEVRW